MKIISIDLGLSRTGIAISDTNEYLASPLCVINERDRKKLSKKISEIIDQNNVSKIVLGLPVNMDGSEGNSAKSARAFADILAQDTNIEIVFQDERGTTVSAHNYLNIANIKSRKRKEIVDAVAATIILQDYLDFRRNQKWN